MRTHGIFGDILCKPLTHDIERHSLLKRVYLELSSGEAREARVSHSEVYGLLWKLRFEGFNTPESAQPFVNAHVLVPEAERLPAPEGQFYFSDFENFDVVDREGKVVGKVLSVQEMPSVNVFNLLIENKEIMAPWIDDCILGIDMGNKRIIVNLEFISS